MMMKANGFLCTLFGVGLCFQGVVRAATSDASASNPSRTNWLQAGFTVHHALESFQHVGERWMAGDTNFPLLSIEWFHDLPGLVMVSSVRRDGVVQNGSWSDFGSKGWGPWGPLDATNLSKLHELVNLLPPGPATTIPLAHQILVYGIRSNSWFSQAYDRADVPFVLERICDLTGGRTDWIVPSVTSTTNLILPGRDGWVHQLTAAAKAPVLASTSAERADVWNLAGWRGTPVPWLMTILEPVNGKGAQAVRTNYFQPSAWSPVVLSPDGERVVLASTWQVIAVNSTNQAVLWVRCRYADYPRWTEEERQQWCGHLGVLDGGKSLAVGLFNHIEKWSFLTGETESVLSTNGVPFRGALKASRDGNVLAADFDNGHVWVWKSPWTDVRQDIVEPTKARLLEISPTGRYLALCGFGRLGERLVIRDLKDGTRLEMPFRGCVAHEWVAGMVWSADGAYAALDQGGSGLPIIYDTLTWKPLVRWSLPYAGPPGRRLAFSADGWLVARFSDGCLHGLKMPLR